MDCRFVKNISRLLVIYPLICYSKTKADAWEDTAAKQEVIYAGEPGKAAIPGKGEMRMNETLLTMSNRELFCVLTGDQGPILQAQLQNIIRLHMKFTEQEHLTGDVDLKTMVAEYAAGKYDSVKEDW